MLISNAMRRIDLHQVQAHGPMPLSTFLRYSDFNAHLLREFSEGRSPARMDTLIEECSVTLLLASVSRLATELTVFKSVLTYWSDSEFSRVTSLD